MKSRINTETLRTLLFRKGLSQTDVARLAGISRGNVSQICNGKSCRESTAQQIADALGVSLEELKA